MAVLDAPFFTEGEFFAVAADEADGGVEAGHDLSRQQPERAVAEDGDVGLAGDGEL